MSMMQKQRGMTLIGFIFVLAILLFVAYLGIKIVPHYLNYYSVTDAMNKVALEPGASQAGVTTIRARLKNVLFVNYVEGLKEENLKVLRTGRGIQIVLDYTILEPIAGNLSVSIHFEKVVTVR